MTNEGVAALPSSSASAELSSAPPPDPPALLLSSLTFAMISTLFARITPTHEYVVPRSMPMAKSRPPADFCSLLMVEAEQRKGQGQGKRPGESGVR